MKAKSKRSTPRPPVYRRQHKNLKDLSPENTKHTFRHRFRNQFPSSSSGPVYYGVLNDGLSHTIEIDSTNYRKATRKIQQVRHGTSSQSSSLAVPQAKTTPTVERRTSRAMRVSEVDFRQMQALDNFDYQQVPDIDVDHGAICGSGQTHRYIFPTEFNFPQHVPTDAFGPGTPVYPTTYYPNTIETTIDPLALQSISFGIDIPPDFIWQYPCRSICEPAYNAWDQDQIGL
ncbi:hypothetical protein GALMADRAFT_133611 [Galerina marginata CBS 339.88]|uniref:Uncharacterized protein n=1 Tax=Galerina marginata (strain CBS 339.88) TaxID=685588 RepID=A0A067TM56_GALM3|nr:hypothetical protein GALMADRAFT_133611 [Galerina marginata CBS 339.88]